jgi:hypothetical protein
MGIDEGALKRGRKYESGFAKRTGGSETPGSGNQHHSKGDVRTAGILWQNKSETKRTWGRTLSQLADAVVDAQGTGDRPALAIDDVDSGQELVLLRMSDFLAILESPAEFAIKPRKGETRRARASTPSMLRD